MDWRTHVRTALDGEHPRIGRSVVLVLYGLIVFSAISISVETLPHLPSWATGFLADAEFAIVGVFTIEYVLRIITSQDRLAYIRSFFGIVDLLAILPFLLSLGVDLRAVRTIRLLRLFRILKIARYSRATRRMATAIHSVKEELIVFGSCAAFVLYLCAIGIYYFEHDAQPEAFSSVFASMWWAAVTLTTVGYGDVYPVTVGGRIFTVIVLFVALGVIAIPTGVISSAMARLRDEDETPEQP